MSLLGNIESSHKCSRVSLALCAALLVLASSVLATTQAAQPPVERSSSSGDELNDRVTRLKRQIEQGDVQLEYQPNGFGYLPDLLKQLDLSVASQVLVFSKTSFQQRYVSPRTPRAIFFGDDVAVGSVLNGEVIELISTDPTRGMVFHTLDMRHRERPHFERRDQECRTCHGLLQPPGMMVASVYPAADGTPFITGITLTTTDHRTPFTERWGGWYVTGTHGAQAHMGNAVAPDPDRPVDLEVGDAQNLTSLLGRIDTTRYLAPTSDIVALMTLEHQSRMTNLLISVGNVFRRGSLSVDSSRKTLDDAVTRVVDYMIFRDEAPLLEPVHGVSDYARSFAARGPRDQHGRSLRDFDLEHRLFRYRLSYMIYSDLFDGLPTSAKDAIYHRLYAILSSPNADDGASSMPVAERHAILDILHDTKRDLPAAWTKGLDR